MKIRGGAESGSLLLSWRGSEDGASDPLASPRQPGNRRRLGTIDGRRIAAPQRVFVETNPLGRASAKNHPANATVPEEKRFRHAIRGRMVGPEGVKKFGQIGSPTSSTSAQGPPTRFLPRSIPNRQRPVGYRDGVNLTRPSVISNWPARKRLLGSMVQSRTARCPPSSW